MKAHQLLLISVMLIAVIGAPVVMADPADLTTYMINFTGTGILPTAGQFTYDPDAPTNKFTNFSVVWGGHTFDLTSSANSPFFGSNPPPCVSSLTTGAQAAFALMSGACTPPDTGYDTSWVGTMDFFSSDIFSFDSVITNTVNGIAVLGIIPKTSDETTFYQSSGSWTTSPIPEPSTLMLLGTGFGAIALAAWRRKKA